MSVRAIVHGTRHIWVKNNDSLFSGCCEFQRESTRTLRTMKDLRRANCVQVFSPISVWHYHHKQPGNWPLVGNILTGIPTLRYILSSTTGKNISQSSQSSSTNHRCLLDTNDEGNDLVDEVVCFLLLLSPATCVCQRQGGGTVSALDSVGGRR